MPRGRLTGLILASALVTLDGTAATIALPAIGRDLSASLSRLQWISNAPLLILAAMLLPAGTVADRFGRLRALRIGLIGFVAGSLACVVAPSDAWLIGGRLMQGAGGALVLPAVLALLRGAYTDAAERTRMFGVWAAWTGVASAAGPLLAGAIVDLWSWRAVFVPSALAGAAAVLLLGRSPAESPARSHPVPAIATAALALLFGGLTFVLMELPSGQLHGWRLLLPIGLAVLALAGLIADPQRHVLLPRDLVRARNCLPANAASFALYFGMFGLSFLAVLYSQQTLGYSALWAAVVLLPVSVMLFLAEAFGRLAARIGTRTLIITGVLCAATGIFWMAAGPHPLPFWSHLIVGTSVFGLGTSLAVSALTHAAVAAVPQTCAGAASGLNHATVRAAGLVAVALLGSIAAPGLSDANSVEGFKRALIVCAMVVAIGGVLGSVLLRDEAPGGVRARAGQ